jgi:hypothetical protein
MAEPEEPGNASVTFADIVNDANKDRAWYDLASVKPYVNLKNGYITVSVLSFVLMAIFGMVNIHVHDDCRVPEPSGRCCKCVELTTQQLDGQTIPKGTSLNSLYYGVVMIINSAFGIYYVITGVQSENKYQMLCMLVTQFLECARGLVDTLLDEADSQEAMQRKDISTGLMAAATVLLVVSCVLVTPVYRSFGWASNRRVGARRSVLQMYKRYQKFRALNRLDVQSSFLLFIIFLGYVAQTEAQGAWVWVALFLCDTFASRFMVKYLKQEDRVGVAISMMAKTFVIAWWSIVVWQYYQCYTRFEDSRAHTEGWYSTALAPNLESVADSFNGVSCLGRSTFHDDRTLEVVFLNLIQALIFRISSMLIGFAVVGNFGKGLKTALYDIEEEQSKVGQGLAEGSHTDDEDDEDDEQMQEFVPTRVVKAEHLAAASSTSALNNSADYRAM